MGIPIIKFSVKQQDHVLCDMYYVIYHHLAHTVKYVLSSNEKSF